MGIVVDVTISLKRNSEMKTIKRIFSFRLVFLVVVAVVLSLLLLLLFAII